MSGEKLISISLLPPSRSSRPSAFSAERRAASVSFPRGGQAAESHLGVFGGERTRSDDCLVPRRPSRRRRSHRRSRSRHRATPRPAASPLDGLRQGGEPQLEAESGEQPRGGTDGHLTPLHPLPVGQDHPRPLRGHLLPLDVFQWRDDDLPRHGLHPDHGLTLASALGRQFVG